MKFNRLLVIAAILSAACSTGGERIARKHVGIPDKLKPHVNEFELLFPMNKIQRDKLSIGFAELMGTGVGVCYRTLDGHNEIELDILAWSLYPEIMRRALMMHELAHCVCNLPHTETRLSDDCPTDYLAPKMAAPRCYAIHRSEYDNLLSKQCKEHAPKLWVEE